MTTNCMKLLQAARRVEQLAEDARQGGATQDRYYWRQEWEAARQLLRRVIDDVSRELADEVGSQR